MGKTLLKEGFIPQREIKIYQKVIMKQAMCFYYNLWCKCIIFQKIVPLGTIDFRPPIESDMDKSFSKLKFQM